MKKRLFALVAMLLAFACLLSACGFTGDTTTTTTTGDGTETTTEAGGKVLRVSMAGAPTDINPVTCSTNEGSEILGSMAEGLVRQNADGEILEGSGLAESWEISEDGTVYTFTLRDATWSDGTPITADQFVYHWEKVLNPASASMYAYMLYVI